MRIWFKQWKDNHMIADITIEDTTGETRTHKIFSALEKACHSFDLAVPIWLDSNVQEFKRISKTRFTTDSFVESVPFDSLEIHVIEED